MGCPLSPIVACIVKVDLETKCISSLPFQPPFYSRYVDDIITAVQSNKITTIKNVFNSYNHKIQFLHYHSHHPLNYKINFINNSVDRGITLAHKSFYKENIQEIKSTLRENNYPLAF